MKIIEFIKKELSGWKNIEIILLIASFILIFLNSIILKDNTIAIISALCGILYTIIAGKGKCSCYLFGLCGSFCYCMLTLQNKLYGHLILNMCYYIPAQIIGFLSWRKHIKPKANEIIKTKLKTKQKYILLLITIFGCFITYYILKYYNDSNPIADSVTTFLSIIGMYLTVKRCIEQWIIWFIVNTISLFMWINVLMSGEKVYSTIVMWSVYIILAIYFHMTWKKELDTQINGE